MYMDMDMFMTTTTDRKPVVAARNAANRERTCVDDER